MAVTREQTVVGRPESLAGLLAIVDEACGAAGVDEETRQGLRLAVEEAVTNVISHGYAGASPGPVTVQIAIDAEAARATISDRAPLFDPSAAPPPDLTSAWEDRPLGGLGWHLITSLMSETRHEARPGGGNVLILTKKREASS